MNTKDQIGLNGLERWLNVENSFKVYNEKCIKIKSTFN